ncbi:MAG: YbaB/EbfC family nucleoid-associated protein [Deltaproteobacteria bacterium]|nr:MAG: YbaB/EbfC family nucleoid-associated protein [Deltaproteobacteria bacterium]
MSQFDMGPMGALLGGFQAKIEAAKKRASETEVTGEAAGGLVKITMTCDYNVHRIEISDAAYEDKDMLEDLIRAAANEALRQARAETAKGIQDLAGGLPIPPGLLGGMGF